jgi:hypothetical protein
LTLQRQICIGLFIVFCWGLSGAIAGGQQLSPAGSKPSPAPTPIPLSEIASQAESTVGTVQSVETSLSTDQITATVEKRLPQLTSEIQLRGTEMAKFLAGSEPLELLHSMEIVLQRYRDQLSSWNHDLTERAKILDSQIAQLQGLSKIWKSTLQLPELFKAAPVFDLPVSTAITLSILIFGSIYSMAPFLLRGILWGIFLISIAVILRRLIDRTLFPMLNALIVLYFVDQLRLITSLRPLLGRLVFGAEMLGGTLFLIWLIWEQAFADRWCQ